MNFTVYIAFLKDIFRKKFVKDSIWLLVSQATLALCGFSLNVLITEKFGVASFGNFSMALKIYLIASIFTSLGVGVSGIKYSAQYAGNREMLDKTMSAAMMVVIISALVITALLFFLLPIFGIFLNNISLKEILLILFTALPFYSINKLLILIINGQRDIVAVSIIQVSRWLLLIGMIIISVFLFDFNLSNSLIAFPITEIILVIATWIYSLRYFSFSFRNEISWLKEHFSFGGKSMFSYAISDITNNLDVFMIGYFFNSRQVGIYCFAADIAKNLLVISEIFSANFNPLITSLYFTKRYHELKNHIRNIRNLTFILYIPIILLACAIYYMIIQLMPDVRDSFIIFIILSTGIFFLSGFRPFNAILELSGFPGAKLFLNSIIMAVTLLLVIFFINFGDINGVAVAIGISYIVNVLLLNAFSRKKLGISLIN